MKGLIEIIGKKAEQPYYIKEMAFDVFTVEELCYLVYHNWYVLDASFMKPELEAFVREQLELPELAQKLESARRTTGELTEYLAVLLKESGFCSIEELRMLLVLLKDTMGNGMPERRKAKADLLVANHKYMAALREYQCLLQECELTEEQKSAIYHNVGTIYARLFCYREAAGYYRCSYDWSRQQDTLLEIVVCSRLAGDEELMKFLPEGDWSAIEAEADGRMKRMAEAESGCQMRKFLSEAKEQREAGQVGVYSGKMKGLLLELKKDYRRSMEI